MPVMTNIEAINNALHLAMQDDSRVMVLGEDVGLLGGVFRATAGLQKKFGPERVVDTPLAEAAIVGTSIGLALNGMRPIPEIQFCGFVLPALNQLLGHAARLRNRSRGRFTVPMTLRLPCGGGIRAPEHHSESPEAYFAHTPGLKVVMPSTPYDSKGMLLAAIADPDPVIFMEHKRLYRSVKADLPEGQYTVPIGPAAVVREGKDLTLIGWGFMRHLAEKVAADLEQQGVSVEVIDVRTIAPLDEQTILDSVNKTGRAIILQEAPRCCGVAAEIAAIIAEKSLFALKAPVERVTGYDITMPLPQGELLQIPNEARAMAAVERVLSY